MKTHRLLRVETAPLGRGFACLKRSRGKRNLNHADEGFTLVELLIVVTIVPLIVGALAAGLLSIFSLQSSVSNRLSDSGDAQMVAATYEPDVQAAQLVNTLGSPPACGSGTQLLGLEWDGQSDGTYNSIVSYNEVPSGSTNNLVREFCGPGSTTPTSTTIVSFNVASASGPNPPVVSVTCSPGSTCVSNTSSPWINSTVVENVTITLNEPNRTETSGYYQYTLAAVPAAYATVSDQGGPIVINSSTGCKFATAGSAPLASSLCFLDFTNLSDNPNFLADAETTGSCLYESVSLNGGWTMYFCLNISNSIAGEMIEPFALPTWCNGFLGNPGPSGACPTTAVFPNFYGVGGEPALYQQGTGGGVDNGGITTITLSQIQLVNGSGVPATGWELYSADAESTDNGSTYTVNGITYAESITWTSSPNTMQVVSNGYTAANGYCKNGWPCDTNTDPFGTACDGGGSWPSSNPTNYGISNTATDTTGYYNSSGNPVPTHTVMCTEPTSGGVGGTLTGAAMVESLTPSTFTAQLGDGTGGLEAVAFGILQS